MVHERTNCNLLIADTSLGASGW